MYRSDSEVLQDFARIFCQIYANGNKIAGIIYLHPITDSRMRTYTRNRRLLNAMYGKTFLSNLVLATSKWDRLSKRNARRKEVALPETELWNYMLTLGAKMYHHDNTKESALRIVDHILSIEGNMSLKIQQEMIEQKCSNQAIEGQQFQNLTLLTTLQLGKELLELQNEYIKAMRSKDLKRMESIEKDRHDLGERIAKLEGVKKELCRDFATLQEEMISRYQSRHQDEVSSKPNLFPLVESPWALLRLRRKATG